MWDKHREYETIFLSLINVLIFSLAVSQILDIGVMFNYGIKIVKKYKNECISESNNEINKNKNKIFNNQEPYLKAKLERTK